jgi:ABC-2 type transport system ATP-binding protein
MCAPESATILSMAACIALKALTKRYGRKKAVSELDLEIETGTALGLLGPNGAGKSTTLGMLCGLVRPSSGSISVFGKDLRRNWIEIAQRMGVLMERPVFFEYMTVRQNLAAQARLAGKTVNYDRALDLVGLLPQARARVGHLSQGMRQRLGLAQAMLGEPELLLLDEPTSGLDVEATQEVLLLLRKLVEEAGVTLVFSSHLLHEVELLCDQVAVLNNGQLVATEKTDTLLAFDETQVEVLLDGAEGAAKKLRKQPWVVSVEQRRSRLLVILREPNAPQLSTFLVNAGYQVAGILPRRNTLQDFFLKVTNG